MEVLGTCMPTERGVKNAEDVVAKSLANHQAKLRRIHEARRRLGLPQVMQAEEAACLRSMAVLQRAASRVGVRIASPAEESRKAYLEVATRSL